MNVLILSFAVGFSCLFGQLGAESDDHWCCDIELTPSIREEYRLKPVRKTKTVSKEIIVGYKTCEDDDFGDYCPIYETKQVEVAYYKMEQVLEKIKENLPCPDEHLVCCGNLILFDNNCYDAEEVEKLKKLQELGIIG